MSEKEPDDPTLEQSVLNSDSKSDIEGTIDSTLNDSQVLDETRSSTTGSSDVTETLEQHLTQEIDVKNEITPQDDPRPGTDEGQDESASTEDECFSTEKGTTKSRDDTLESTENCSDIDRLHKHVTELQNTMAKEKVVDGRNEHGQCATGSTPSSDTRENEKKHATRIADMLLERLKDQGKVEEDANEEDDTAKESIAVALLQRWKDMSEKEAYAAENSSSEDELMQSDLEKSLNESVEKVLPSQDTEIESRERTYKDEVVDYLNNRDVDAKLKLEEEHSQHAFSFLKKSLINLAHKYHTCENGAATKEHQSVLWTLWFGPRDDLCVPQYPCSRKLLRGMKVENDTNKHDLVPFATCKSKRPYKKRLRSRKSGSHDNENIASQWSSRDDSDGMLVAPHDMAEPIPGAASDGENNDLYYWPEFEEQEPEPENDPDFTVDDDDTERPKRRRKRGRKPKHPIKIKLRKHSTPSVDEPENPDYDVTPKSEPDVDAMFEDFASKYLLPVTKKKRGRPVGSKSKVKEEKSEEDDKEPEPEEKTQTQTPPGTGLSFTALAAPYKDNAQCYYCQKVFLTKWKMNKHMSAEHRNGKGGFDCPIPECNSTFQKVTFLIRHHRSHMGKSLLCPICPNKAFHRMDHLKKHLRTHESWENDTSCMCSVCGKKGSCDGTGGGGGGGGRGGGGGAGEWMASEKGSEGRQVLSRPDHLKKHERRHLTETIFSCKFCGRRFTHEWKLERHEASHSTIRVHKCEICHRSFTSHITLKYHVKRHTGEKPFKCSKCPKAFYDEAHLKKHEMLNHSDKAGFMCSICGISFRYEYGLRRHERRHELQDENGKYTCKYCDKTFADSWKARRHEQIHGAERIRPYKCSTCTKAFFTRGALEVHERIHADLRPYSCEVCGKSFRQSQELTAHMRIHTGERPFICATCGQSFTTASNLRRHEKGKHAKEKNHYCMICNKGFHRGTDLRRHHATHTGQKPHSCPQCSMHFTTAYSVRRHLEKAHGKIYDGPKRRRPVPPPPQPRTDPNQTQSDVKPTQEQQAMLQQQQPQQQQQQHMEQPQNLQQQPQQQQSDCQQQQQNQSNNSKNNQSPVHQDCKQADEYKHGTQQSLRGQEVPLAQSQPPPLLTAPPPPAHDPPTAHTQHVHSSHKHYPVHGEPSVHVPRMHVPSTSHTGQLGSHHITSIPQYHGAPDRPVFPERSHMDRPMFPPHNDRDPARPGFSGTHNPHGHDRDPRPVFPGNERPLLPPDQLMERAMRGDGQFFYPLNLIQQAPMHFNMDQLLHMASQSDGSPMPMPHPPNSISQ